MQKILMFDQGEERHVRLQIKNIRVRTVYDFKSAGLNWFVERTSRGVLEGRTDSGPCD